MSSLDNVDPSWMFTKGGSDTTQRDFHQYRGGVVGSDVGLRVKEDIGLHDLKCFRRFRDRLCYLAIK